MTGTEANYITASGAIFGNVHLGSSIRVGSYYCWYCQDGLTDMANMWVTNGDSYTYWSFKGDGHIYVNGDLLI